MKFLLIGVYLAYGAAMPQYDYREFKTLEECRAVSTKYIQKAVKGSKWAICAPLKEAQA